MVENLQVNIMSILLLVGAMCFMQESNQIASVKTRSLRWVIICAMAMCVTDCVTILCEKKTFTGAREMLIIANVVYYEGVIGVCWAWLNYVEITLGRPGKPSLAEAVIFAMCTLLILSTPITGLMFTIDESNDYTRSGGVIVHWIVAWGYLVVATVKVYACIKKAKSKIEKQKLRPYFEFIIIPVVASTCQMFSLCVSAMQCGVAISIVLLLAREMRANIQKDSLTGLNNRGALHYYLKDAVEKGAQQLSIFMMDVDNFKTINDKYGHREGDKIIRFLANTLKHVAGNWGRALFLCRYGGDEFIMIGKNISQTEDAKILAEIEQKIQAANDNGVSQMKLGLSIGVASGTCATIGDTEKLIEKADQEMYAAKQAKKAALA